MAINKLIHLGEVKLDLTDSVVTAETLAEGAIAYGANGERIVGTGLFGNSDIFEVTELPTENIDTKSFYLCNGEYYKYVEGGNTWVFNDELTLNTTLNCQFAFEFEGYENTKNGTKIVFMSFGSSCPHIRYITDYYPAGQVGNYQYVEVYGYDASYLGKAGWQKEEYKTIVLKEMPTDENSLAWLKANATPSSGWRKVVFPDGFINITEDGIYDVADYAKVSVKVINGKPIEVEELPDNCKKDSVYLVNGTFMYESIYGTTMLVSPTAITFNSNDDGTCSVTQGNGYIGGQISIPAYSPDTGDRVTSIGEEAFRDCNNLASIVIPDCVTTIGNRAFQNCALTSIVIPDSVTSIGNAAFANCGLTSIEIPESVVTINGDTFYSSGLTSVIIPDSITSLEPWAFANCHSLTSVTIGNGITTLGYCTFQNCINLTDITFNGTIAQWNILAETSTSWNENVPATHVTCSDGTVTL